MAATPNMGLVIPVPTITAAPQWGSQLVTAFSTIDSHNHAPGSGGLIPTAGLRLDADLAFNLTAALGLNATGLRSTRFLSQTSLAGALDVGCVYNSGGNLFWNNGSGQAVQITSGATLSATSLGGISGLPSGTASAAFGSATFTWRSATNVAATMDAGPVIIRDTGASALGITLVSPVGLAGAYSITLPSALPAALSLLSFSASGALGLPTGPVSANTQRIANVVDPSGAQDAATKNYVDARTAQISMLRLNADNPDADTQPGISLGALIKFNSFAHSKTVGAFTNDGTGRITVTNAGTYRIFCSLTANAAGGTALNIAPIVAKNGSALATVGQSTRTNLGMANAAGEVLYDLAAADFIEAFYSTTGGSAGTATMAYGQLVVQRIV